ncbi:cation/H(+) antiporter 15-like [Malania oleifera]|uniref:cation/H(+) antiporter 15-like n=1 Tax=Malania oleifera TaxID=397392 RepID=UPI0025AE13EB|nr:cation/H(+) antiporter 15-like [Malania oleifera]
MIGPLLMGRWQYFRQWILPYSNLYVWETIANFGILLHAFHIGLETDVKAVLRPGRKALSLALVSVAASFLIGYKLFHFVSVGKLETSSDKVVKHNGGLPILSRGGFFCGAAFTVTSFSTVANALRKQKLLHTELGRMAMSAAVITEVALWGILALGVPMTISLYTLEWAAGTLVLMALVFHNWLGPGATWMMQLAKSSDDEELNEGQAAIALMGVMLAAFMADMSGMHSIVGAFMFGISLPDRVLRSMLLESMEETVTGLFLPLFYAYLGMRMDPTSFDPGLLRNWGRFCFTVLMASGAKSVISAAVCLCCKIGLRDSVTVGWIVSTKTVMAVIMLYLGLASEREDESGIANYVLAVMLTSMVTMSSVTIPILSALNRPSRHLMKQTCRSVEELKPDSDFRILTGIYTVHDVPGLINLLQISCSTSKSPVVVFALRLVELTGSCPAKFFIQDMRKPTGRKSDQVEAESDQIIEAFDKYQSENVGSSVTPLFATSPYFNMHEDVCSLATDKRITLIIVPFHQQQTVDGSMENENPFIRGVNQMVLNHAPCSVGIFIDRGFGNANFGDDATHRVLVYFFGGPDDREALYYGWRMRYYTGVTLTVVRFVLGDEATENMSHLESSYENNPLIPFLQPDYERQKQFDDVVVDEFRTKTSGDEMIRYLEKESNNGEETVTVIRSMEHDYDLYVVGKGDRLLSPLTLGLNDWSDWPELGAVGDILASSEFASRSSVLVLQQHAGAAPVIEGMKLLDGTERNVTESVHNHRVSSRGTSRPGRTTQDFQ